MTRFYMPIVWKAISYDTIIASTMGYDTDEPYAINIEFRDEFGTEWMFSRDLIEQGLESTAGEGDVLCWSSDERFFLMLRNPVSSLLLSASLGAIEYFLDYTHILMPPGDEIVDIDSLLERLLE